MKPLDLLYKLPIVAYICLVTISNANCNVESNPKRFPLFVGEPGCVGLILCSVGQTSVRAKILHLISSNASEAAALRRYTNVLFIIITGWTVVQALC